MSKVFALILAIGIFGTVASVAQPVKRESVRHTIIVSSTHPGTLTIENYTPKSVTFTVYSITGQVVRTVELKNDSTTISLPQGFYIVKSDNGTMKVAVK